MDLTDPVAAALLTVESLEKASLPCALCGGLLLAAYGDARETRDVDLAVVRVSVDDARRALQEAGIESSPNFDGVAYGGLLIDRLTLLGGEATLGLNAVDLVRPRSERYAQAALDRAVTAPLRDRSIRVLTPEDYVVFKLLSTRDRDLSDAASVFRRTGEQLDASAVEREIEALAGEIPDWDVRGRLADLRLLLGD